MSCVPGQQITAAASGFPNLPTFFLPQVLYVFACVCIWTCVCMSVLCICVYMYVYTWCVYVCSVCV